MSSSASGGGYVDLTQVPLPQLASLQERISKEVNQLTAYLSTLRAAHNRYISSKSSLEQLKKQTETTLLVPLTEQLYVPGTLKNPDAVLIDVGTGYFMKKPISAAQETLDRRIRLVRESAEKLAKTIQDQKETLERIQYMMSMKQQAALQHQQQQQ
ncbi:hypothetical protein FDP41_012905 [Naegleria fowleri]|uniref:Prefoldin subunit 5 n=1 Tax=Naegleria fowleri TaxID=5763 RepID=A0A6A5BV75_NAEFO|nr:uncharacterized protein FDP41_012905 [Naegleria fowleri]KAF0981117.1 hypothetical protein FDP41_012905 [Naegleria fowleri]CAG4708370.1 unnamed protein product [Naegleria fowleri]